VWILLRIVAGIVALDALIVAGLALSATLEARRSRREIRDLEHLWRFDERVRSGFMQRAPGRRVAAVATAATLVCSMTAVASPQARHVIASAFEPVVRELHGQTGHEEQAAAPAPVRASAVAPPLPIEREDHPKPAARPGPAAAVEAAAHLVPASTRSVIEGPAVVVALSNSSTVIELGWSDVAGERGFRVERSRDGAMGWVAVARTKADVTAYDDTKLSPGTTYFYRVFATGLESESPPSDVVSATTGALPTTPQTVTAVSGSPKKIDLSWADVEAETGYRIERSPDGILGWLPIATTGQDVTTYTDSGLSPGTTYFYRIVATSRYDDADPSEVVSATTSSHPLSKNEGEYLLTDLTT
jgi:fibronectin type 3 domain-containing protein